MASRPALANLLIFLLAAAWRLAYLGRLAVTPFAGSLNADSRIYWAWSGHIVRHGVESPAPFFLAPLYPYVLAAWRFLGARTIHDVLAVQAVIGAAGVVLLTDAIRRLYGPRIAIGAGCVLALFQPTTFFDGLVLGESLLFFLESLLVWFVIRTDWSRAGAARYAGYGLIVGVIAVGRASQALLLVPLLLLARASGEGAGRRARLIGIAVAAFAVCALVTVVANQRASGEPIPFTYGFGYNLEVGNNPDADGTYVDVTQGSTPVPLPSLSPTTGAALDGRAYLLARDGVRLTAGASSAFWSREALAFVAGHPFQALRVTGRKLLLMWNRRDLPQIESMESSARAAGPLGLPLAGSFAAVALLGLAGIPFASRGEAAEQWLVAALCALMLGLAPFFVTDRYRLHFVPTLALLAAAFIAALARAWRDRSPRARAYPLVALAIAAAIVFAPIARGSAPSGEWAAIADQAMRLEASGSYDAAAEHYARAESALDRAPARLPSPNVRAALASFYSHEAATFEALGRDADAVSRWERAVALDSNDAGSLGRLRVAYEREGRPSDAERMARRLMRVPGGRGQLLLDQGWSAAARGDPAAAESLFSEATRAAPDLALAFEGLLRIEIQARRYGDASRDLDRAMSAGLDPVPAAIYRAFLAVQREDWSEARRALGEVPRSTSPGDPVLARLASYSRAALENR
jgi:tetratricopeptide (TPR) repeat protein